MVIETIVISLAAIVLGGTYMGLKFAAEFDPKLRSNSKQVRKLVDQAVSDSILPNLYHQSKDIVKTQVFLYPQSFDEEERKRLIEWVNTR